jgi:peptidoglycan/xylan/chitin deacetylase (PgdA/CDA1 family)
VSLEGVGTLTDSAMQTIVSRREFLRYAGLAGATIVIGGCLGGLLAACDGTSTTMTGARADSTAPATSETTGAVSPETTEGQTGAASPATTESHPSTKPNEKVAYLTFDDGPSGLTPELLHILDANHVTATFFVIGLHAQQYPGALKEIARRGNAIGVHSWTHDYSYVYKNTTNFLADFNKMKDYIHHETGLTPNVCRFPGGTNNTVCFRYSEGHIMQRIVVLVEGMGFKYYDWNVSSAEASSPPPSTDTIISNVVSQCKSKKTAVILFHDTDNQGYVDAIPEVIAKLRSMGFTFQTLSPDSPPKSRSASVQFKPS